MKDREQRQWHVLSANLVTGLDGGADSLLMLLGGATRLTLDQLITLLRP